MSLESIKARLPDYARDLKLNLSTLAGIELLSESQRAGTFIACALAAREPSLIEAMMAEFGPALSAAQMNGVKVAAAIMGMNNIYYRSIHMISHPDYSTMRSQLRMNVLASPGAPKEEFDLWCLAVSAINACSACLDSHEKVLREAGLSSEQIQAGLRIAAVVHATARVLESETVLRTPIESQAA